MLSVSLPGQNRRITSIASPTTDPAGGTVGCGPGDAALAGPLRAGHAAPPGRRHGGRCAMARSTVRELAAFIKAMYLLDTATWRRYRQLVVAKDRVRDVWLF